ncbi:MAG TPA: TatD family hydrolase [Acidimicrobiia bacterium]|nr:TatD family hydrolase [Acidimicrobiia bacterium]
MSEPTWIDSHCHLQLGSSAGDVAAAEAQVARAVAAGVTTMVCVGTDLETSRHALDLAARHHEVYATVGLHPHDASKLSVEWGQLEVLAHADRVVGVGEAGFDLYYEHSPRAEQEHAFRFQIHLAKRLDRTLVIHSRDAWDDTFRVLDDEVPPDRTVFHCFTGGPAEAERALALGAYLSFSGIVSFANADDLRAAAAVTPADRMLVETDAPFLTPVPHRGRENEPAYVVHVGAALAAARDEPVAAVAECTSANARRAFGLDAPR